MNVLVFAKHYNNKSDLILMAQQFVLQGWWRYLMFTETMFPNEILYISKVVVKATSQALIQ